MVVHPQIVMKGHLAGCAAAKQGKFIEFKRTWWEKAYLPYQNARDPSKLGDENIDAIAKGLELDMTKFKADLDGSECKERVNGDMQELAKWHVNATPNFFVNGRYFVWNGDPSSFKVSIDDRIKAAEASGVPCGEYYEKEVIAKGEQKYRKKGDPKPN
jgi:predicted DsbA family dithiol-disulfide isomerase